MIVGSGMIAWAAPGAAALSGGYMLGQGHAQPQQGEAGDQQDPADRFKAGRTGRLVVRGA